MKLESTTYHYAAKPGAHSWPTLKKTYSKTMHYQPDSVSFDIHVTTETRTVKAKNIRVSGFRVVKDGLSEHRVSDNFYANDHALPPFVAEYIEQALDNHRA